jgi:hypothetical protein
MLLLVRIAGLEGRIRDFYRHRQGNYPFETAERTEALLLLHLKGNGAAVDATVKS